MLRTLRSSVHNDFRHEAEENELEQADCKSEACPIMPVLQDLQTIAIELNLAIKVHVVEGLHRNLVSAAVLDLVGFVLEGKVVLNGASRKSGLFVLARGEHRMEGPECNEDGDGSKEAEEYGSLQPAADLPCEVEGDEAEQGEEEDVGESFSSGSICWDWGIFYCWELEIGQQNSIELRRCIADAMKVVQRTEVVLTPQSSNFSNVGVGAFGVSMNSNSLSEPWTL